MDLACGLQGHFGQQRADQLVDQNGEQRNVADQIALRAELARRHAHAERDAGLRQQGDAEILADLRLTFHELCGVMRAEILAKRARQNIHNADENDHTVFEHAQIQLRTGNDKERRKKRACPAVRLGHDLLRQRAQVTKQRAEHHACQKRREADRDRADLEFRHGQRRDQEYQRDGHIQTIRVGVEQRFQFCQHPAAERAEHQRTDNLKQRVDDNGNDVEGVCVERLRNAERDSENDQTDRVVQRHNRQQQVYQRTLCLILTNDHQRRCRGCCGCDSAQGNGLCNGKLAFCNQANDNKRKVNQKRCGQRLQNTDDKGLSAGFFEL